MRKQKSKHWSSLYRIELFTKLSLKFDKKKVRIVCSVELNIPKTKQKIQTSSVLYEYTHSNSNSKSNSNSNQNQLNTFFFFFSASSFISDFTPWEFCQKICQKKGKFHVALCGMGHVQLTPSHSYHHITPVICGLIYTFYIC